MYVIFGFKQVGEVGIKSNPQIQTKLNLNNPEFKILDTKYLKSNDIQLFTIIHYNSCILCVRDQVMILNKYKDLLQEKYVVLYVSEDNIDILERFDPKFKYKMIASSEADTYEIKTQGNPRNYIIANSIKIDSMITAIGEPEILDRFIHKSVNLIGKVNK